MLRAARLDGSLYAEVRTDSSATGQALAFVAFVALAHGLGGVIRGAYFGWNPASGLLLGVVGELSFFAAASFVTYLTTRYVLGGAIDYPQVFRPFGFSVSPGLLVLIAALASLIGASVPVFVVLIIWRLAAGFVVLRWGIGVDVVHSGVALVASAISGLAAVAIATRTLVELLQWLGVSG